MHSFYQPYIEREDKIYRQISGEMSATASNLDSAMPVALCKALNWLCQDVESILDFGCGNGSLLASCAARGVTGLLGIDLSAEAVRCAGNLDIPHCKIWQGSLERLADLPAHSVQGVILSNILDNLRPEDAEEALQQTRRLLTPQGKALVKLNQHLSPEQIRQWNVTVLEGDLLDDGLLLWNRTTEQWQQLLCKYFQHQRLVDVYFEAYDQHNRMFLCQVPIENGSDT